MDYEIVGRLIAQGEAWDLLELAPREISFDRGVRRVLRETTLEFLVLIDDEPRYILVAGGFVIIPKVEPEEVEEKGEISHSAFIDVEDADKYLFSDLQLTAKEN